MAVFTYSALKSGVLTNGDITATDRADAFRRLDRSGLQPVSLKPKDESGAAPPAAKAAKKTMIVSDEQRYRMIAEAAYYRAESNQFKSDPVRDWIEAESDIAALLSGSK